MDKPTDRKSKEPWHAISIVPALDACPAAVKLRDHRFLSKETPNLPLPDCTDRAECRCTYKHYAGRRAGLRRASDGAGIEGKPPDVDRRKKRGRRKADYAD